MTQPDPNAEVPAQLQATIANMLDVLASRPPSALLGQAYPDLNPQQQEKVWKDMLANYAKDATGGTFEAFELNRPHIQDDGDRAKRDEARRQLYEQIAAAHGQQLNWQKAKEAGVQSPAAVQVGWQNPTATDIAKGFAEAPGGIADAGAQQHAKMIAEQGYVGLSKPEAIESHRKHYPGWREQVESNEVRFYPPEPQQALEPQQAPALSPSGHAPAQAMQDVLGGKQSAEDMRKNQAEGASRYASRIAAGERPEDVLVGVKKGGALWNKVMAEVANLTGVPQPTPSPPPQSTPATAAGGGAQQPPTPPSPPTPPPGPPPSPPPQSAGMPEDDDEREQRRLRNKLRLRRLRDDPTYQRIYNTPLEEWGPEDVAVAGRVQHSHLELEAEAGETAPWAEAATGRRSRTGNPARDAYYAAQREERLERQRLSYAAAVEEQAAPAPPSMGQDRTPPPRNAWQRARAMAQEAGFVRRPDVPEAFQTDEWKAANAPLSQGERLQFGLDAAAVAGFGYLGRQAVQGATSFVSDEGTGRVLGDVGGTIGQGLTNISTGAAAGMQLGGPVGAAVGAVVGGAATIATLPQKIMEWSQALVDSRDKLAMWSGLLQAMKRESEIRGYARDIQSARETAPWANDLNQSLQDVYDELRPIKDDVYKMAALLATGTLQIIKPMVMIEKNTGILLSMFGLVRVVAQVAEWWRGEQTAEDTTVQAWARAWTNVPIPSARVPRR